MGVCTPSANPVIGSTEELVTIDRRATVSCGGVYRFLTAAHNRGYNDAIAHITASTTVLGKNNNPEFYGDQPPVAGIPTSCKQNTSGPRIYPVYLQAETAFVAGSNPGLDRVVISLHTNGTRERCGLITHRGAAQGQSKFCGI
ncbi:hypothetical protein GQ44DRAFT_736157 [Phaeosphaeriaceae sp. PMI808]|nr:hypothetical protein GQ44DRAFT_736157 [Phaeosphaeriaceae sp. PMI808]